MNGWKLGITLGVLVIVVAITLTSIAMRIGRSSDPGSSQAVPIATDAQMKRAFGGVVITQTGGIAGITRTIDIDRSLHAKITDPTDTRTMQIDPANAHEFLQAVADLSAAAGTSRSTDDYPDQIHVGISLTWNGKHIEADGSSAGDGAAIAQLASDLTDSAAG